MRLCCWRNLRVIKFKFLTVISAKVLAFVQTKNINLSRTKTKICITMLV